MKNTSTRTRAITAARRALIIQRVIVDGWTSGKAACTFDVPERLIDAWVVEYRRHGMASLRGGPSRTPAAKIVQLTVSRPIQASFRGISIRLRRFFVKDPLVQPLPLRRSGDDGRGSGS
jgi:hypothetical protein